MILITNNEFRNLLITKFGYTRKTLPESINIIENMGGTDKTNTVYCNWFTDLTHSEYLVRRVNNELVVDEVEFYSVV